MTPSHPARALEQIQSLPSWLAGRVSGGTRHGTLCLALYPRNELLKDQLRALVGFVQRIRAAGGPTIISQVVQALVRRIDLGLPLDQALAQPRIHHQWSPDLLRVENRIDASIQKALTDRGHKLTVTTAQIGVTQAIEFDRMSKQFIGVHDPRVPGKAAGP